VSATRWRYAVSLHDALPIFSRQGAPHAADGVFDAALLPGGVRIAEEGAELQLLGEPPVLGELGAVVEGERAAQRWGQSEELAAEALGDGRSGLSLQPLDGQEARATFMGDQHVPAIAREGHEISLPMARSGAVGGLGGPLTDRAAVPDVVYGGTAPPTLPAAAVLGPWQQAVPVVLLRRAVIDEAVDGLVADDRPTVLERQPA